jgi:hypothetical protein
VAPEAQLCHQPFRLSVGSHLTAIVVGAVAATAYLTVYSNSPQSLADYLSTIWAKSFGSAPAAEAPYLAESVSAMTKMMIDMGIRPSGDVDTDFVAMMVPHHQGAIDMALAALRESVKLWRLLGRPGFHKIAAQFGVATGTVQRIAAEPRN